MNAVATPVRTKARVLCVDDEPNILRSLRWLLQKDFEVEIAASGYDGLELVRHADYDVVISDQRMPGMIGSDFLREVRKVSPRSMRILLTGYSDPQAILKSVNESEVFRFVNKPWQFQELLKVVGDAARIARESPVGAPAAEPAPDAPVDVCGEAILVIDDDEDARRQIAEAIGPVTTLLHARDMAEALLAMEQPVGIVVANMRVGGVDATRMIKLLKQQHPDIVALVYTDATDSVDVISLINQAQVFRFMPKPVKPTTLRMALSAATLKRRALQADPSARRRHAVEALGAAERQSLVADVQRVAQAKPGRTVDTGSLLGRLGGGLKRLFGMAA